MAKHKGQGRSKYSLYVRGFDGEHYFGDYPTRLRAAIDAQQIVEQKPLSIILEDNWDGEKCWEFVSQSPNSFETPWIEIDNDEDQDDD